MFVGGIPRRGSSTLTSRKSRTATTASSGALRTHGAPADARTTEFCCLVSPFQLHRSYALGCLSSRGLDIARGRRTSVASHGCSRCSRRESDSAIVSSDALLRADSSHRRLQHMATGRLRQVPWGFEQLTNARRLLRGWQSVTTYGGICVPALQAAGTRTPSSKTALKLRPAARAKLGRATREAGTLLLMGPQSRCCGRSRRLLGLEAEVSTRVPARLRRG